MLTVVTILMGVVDDWSLSRHNAASSTTYESLYLALAAEAVVAVRSTLSLEQSVMLAHAWREATVGALFCGAHTLS